MEIKKLSPNDLPLLKDLVGLYARVFNENVTTPPDTHLQSLLDLNHTFFFVALDEARVMGGLTAHVLPSVYFPASLVYVYDIAVETEKQRQGIGTALMQELKNYCRALGVREIFLQADLVDDYALRFYDKIGGGREEGVVHFNFPLQGP